MLGVISDAQVSEVVAVADLWPDVPHQTCQFHYLREASRPMYDLDQKTRTAMRKTIQSKLRETRTQLRHHIHDLGDATEPAQLAEREQLQILADYATGIQTALNLEGNRPFAYPGLAGYDALTEVEVSDARSWEKRGRTEPSHPNEVRSSDGAGRIAKASESRSA